MSSVHTRSIMLYLCMGLLSTLTTRAADIWESLLVGEHERKVERLKPGLFGIKQWEVTGYKKTLFTLESGTVTFFQGISSAGTNFIIQKIYTMVETSVWDEVTVEMYYFRYAPGGMVTNIVGSRRIYNDPVSLDEWIVGKNVRTTGDIRITDSGYFTLLYDNSSEVNWKVEHTFEGNNGRFKASIIVPAGGTKAFSPSLVDAKEGTGDNFRFFHPVDFDWWPLPPEDEFFGGTTYEKIYRRRGSYNYYR